jgi:hypothetical protein
MKTENISAIERSGEIRMNLACDSLFWQSGNIRFINYSSKKNHEKGEIYEKYKKILEGHIELNHPNLMARIFPQ